MCKLYVRNVLRQYLLMVESHVMFNYSFIEKSTFANKANIDKGWGC